MTSVELTNVVIAALGVLTTGLATLAAFKSAQSAKAAQDALIQEQARAARHEVSTLAAGCSFEYKRVLYLGNVIDVIDRHTAVMVGAVGGSRHQMVRDGLAKRMAEAKKLIEPAARCIDDPNSIALLSVSDTDVLRFNLTQSLSALRAIADEIDRDSRSREAQLMQLRDDAMAKASQRSG